MKKFTEIIKEAKNPGNDGNKTGVTNHYTPVENILTNIRNLFCTQLSIVAEKGEDGLSIKLSSSKFTNKQTTNNFLYAALYNDFNYNGSSLYGYITAQGLTKVTQVDLGGYIVVYFSPEDIKTAQDPKCMAKDSCPCPCESNESVLDEFEMTSLIKEDDGEEEMKSQTVEKVLELLDGPDKVKAAKQLELLVANEIQLPREYYFAAVKFKSGEEAIALRWKHTKKMPFGKTDGDGKYKEVTVENTRSIMHIFGKGEQAIWVQDYDEDGIVELPDDVKKLIDNILDLLEADKTDNPSVFKLTGERKEREDNNEDDDKKEDDKEDKKDDKKDKTDLDNDDEDDDSRGDKSDDLP